MAKSNGTQELIFQCKNFIHSQVLVVTLCHETMNCLCDKHMQMNPNSVRNHDFDATCMYVMHLEAQNVDERF